MTEGPDSSVDPTPRGADKDPTRATQGPKPPSLGGPTAFEEALNVAGNGRYNILLAITCAFILLTISIDMFGFSLVVTAACDLNLDLTQKSLVLSLPFFGILLTSYIWGYIADTCGRRFTLIISINIGFLLSIISSLSYNWIVLAILKFFAVCFYSAANSSAYTLVGESCIARLRSRYALMMTCLLILSPAVASGLAYPTLYHKFSIKISWLGIVFKPWRLLIIVLSLPLGVGGILIYFFYESPKFLANWNRKEEALEVIKKIHSINSRGRRGPFTIQSIYLEDERVHKDMSFCRKIIEQGAPLFRKPLLRRTVQLYYLIAVVYLTNNSLVVWLPQIIAIITEAVKCKKCKRGDICTMMNTHMAGENATHSNQPDKFKVICKEQIEDLAILTLMASQFSFGILNFFCSLFPERRRIMMISIHTTTAIGAILVSLMPEPISSVFFYVVITGTCLGMGILASYFIDLYPTSYRGMVQCLSIMVARTGTFCGVHIVGQTVFTHCRSTFIFFTIFGFSGAIVAWFLPCDKPIASTPPPTG